MITDQVDFYYRIMWAEFQGSDALYEDYIIHLIGVVGLNALRDNRLMETCGVVNGRQLYVLCPAPTLKGRCENES